MLTFTLCFKCVYATQLYYLAIALMYVHLCVLFWISHAEYISCAYGVVAKLFHACETLPPCGKLIKFFK